MTALVKGIKVSDLTRSNLFVTIALLLLVVALFFIPELIDFQRTMDSSSGSGREAAPREESATELQSAQESKEASGLERIMGLLDSGYIDRLKARKAKEEINEMDAAVPAKVVPQKRSVDALEEVEKSLSTPSLAQLGLPSGEEISWKQIRSQQTSRLLKEAQKEAQALARSLPKTHEAARYALYNFANGISRVLEGAEKNLSAIEALAYIEHLDYSVTETFLRDRVERSDYMRWAEVSLGPLFASSRSQRFKTRAVPSFNPRLTLSKVEVRQPADRFGRWKPNGKAFAWVEGYVVGRDARKIVLTLDGEPIRRAILAKRADTKGRRLFKIPRFNARGVYAIEVLDREGNKHVRHFDFYGRAANFFWDKRGGHFRIPFQPNDPRFNSYFRVGSVSRSGGYGNLRSAPEAFPMQAF